MLNILIKETDLFFRAGLQYFLVDFFSRNFKHHLHFNYVFTADSVSMADIVVLSLCNGEMLTCFPEFKYRKKGIVIGLVDDAFRFQAMSSCFQDIIFISRNASLDQVSETLFIAWLKMQLPGYSWNKNTCLNCQHRVLSPQQVRIMVSFYRGLSVMQIADALRISDKTVFTHKYILMQKFDLRSDYELIALLNRLVAKNSHPNVFRDYLEKDFSEESDAETPVRQACGGETASGEESQSVR